VTWPTIVKPETNRTGTAFSWAAARADLASLKPDEDLREQLDLDSMDSLNVVVGLHAALGVEITEADYPRFATLEGGVEYLTARHAAGVRR
jgi:acyl carrier protein